MIDGTRDEVDDLNAKIRRMEADLANKDREIERWREGLREYGRHRPMCSLDSPGRCDCGLMRIIAGDRTDGED